MRPINLIPPEERRGGQAPLRSGPVAYILVGALVAVLVGVTALVLTDSEIAEREGEVATLEAEVAAAGEKAARLSAYTDFRELSEQRRTTVASLADSRFDWERVMRELALILPDSAWLTSLTASAAPGAGGSGGSSGGSGLRGGSGGPALEIGGCATGQEAVAGFVTALKDIDGVTRVGVQSSALGEGGGGDGEGGGSGGGGGECRTRAFIAQFEIVAVFDAAPVPPTASGGESSPASVEASSPEGAEESEGEEESPEAAGGEG